MPRLWTLQNWFEKKKDFYTICAECKAKLLSKNNLRHLIISLLNPLVVYNTKLQGRSRIRRTHYYTWHRRQKHLNLNVTVGNKITKAVRSDKAEFRTGKTRPQPVPMSDIRGMRQQVWKEPGLLDVRYKMPASLITARQQCRQATAHECRLIRAIWKNDS